MHTPDTIKKARRRKGLTQEDLARVAGVSLATVVRLERRILRRLTAPAARVSKALGLGVAK